MQENLLNILSGGNKDIDNQKLMDYISGKLTPEQRHEVEKLMADNPFLSEALEGIQQAGTEKTSLAVEQLNRQLRSQLQQRKRKKEKKATTGMLWTYVAVLVILMIAVVVYLVITAR